MTGSSAFVIGGGPLGLSTANELSKLNISITLFEIEDQIGGLARSMPFHGVLVDYVYHFFYWNDHHTSLSLLEESVGKIQLKWKDVSTDSFLKGETYDFDSIFSIARLTGLQFPKIILSLLKLSICSPSRKIDEKNAITWSKSTFGQIFSEKVWEPLVNTKFGEKARYVSALWLATRVRRHLSTKIGQKGRSRFSYLSGTYQPFFDSIEKCIIKADGSVNCSEKVVKLEFDKTKIVTIVTDKARYDCSHANVFSSIPLADLYSMVQHEPRLEYLADFETLSAVVVVLALKNKLSDHYWTTIVDENIPFTVVIQQNRLENVCKDELVYLSRYCLRENEIYLKSDEMIYREFIKGLENIFPEFIAEEVLESRVIRLNSAAPIPKINTTKILPGFSTPFSNFWHGGFEHAFPEDRGVGNSFKIGKDMIQEHLLYTSEGS